MRLIDNNKRFAFIKNQIVEIDKELPKYLKLKVIEDSGADYDAVDPNARDVYGEPSGQPLSEVVSPVAVESTPDGRQRYLIAPNVGGRRVSTRSSDVDKDLCGIIMGMKSNDIRKYLGSKDAEEFNKLFLPIMLGEVRGNWSSLNIPDSNWGAEVSADGRSGTTSNEQTLIERIKAFFGQRAKDKEKSTQPDYTMTLLDLFDVIHVEAGKEREFIDRLEGYFKLIRNAAMMHQQAQMDELCQKIVLNVYESVLALHGYNRYITFGNIEKLQSKCKVVLDIDYIKHFGRVIPEDVIAKKTQCDELSVFDNYCVLYYDPEGRAYKATAKEKRDPILFGLINHSDKLYYIADWIDDKCDLTLEAIAEKLGKDTIEEIEGSSKN